MRPQPARPRLRLPARQAGARPGSPPAATRRPGGHCCRSTSAAAGRPSCAAPGPAPGLTASGRRVTAFHLGRRPRRRAGAGVRVTYWLYRPTHRLGADRSHRPAARRSPPRPAFGSASRTIRPWSRWRRSPAGTTTCSRRARNLPGAGRSPHDRAIAASVRAAMRKSRFAWKAALLSWAPLFALTSSPHSLCLHAGGRLMRSRGHHHRRDEMEEASGQEHKRLEALIGRWKTNGSTREMPGAPAVTIDAVDTYEWLHGGLALLHTVDAKMGEEEGRRRRDHRLRP